MSWKIFLLMFGYVAATGYGNNNQLEQSKSQQQQQIEQPVEQLAQETAQQVNSIQYQQRRYPIHGIAYNYSFLQYLYPVALFRAAMPALTQNQVDTTATRLPYREPTISSATNPKFYPAITSSQIPTVLHRVPLTRNEASSGLPRTYISENLNDPKLQQTPNIQNYAVPVTQAASVPFSTIPTQLIPVLLPATTATTTTTTTATETALTNGKVIITPHDRFSTYLFQTIAPLNALRNINYSPISLQTLLAFIYIGAQSRTAQELQQSLQIPSNKTEVASLFRNLLEAHRKSGDAELIMANKLYYNNNLIIVAELQNYAKFHFGAEIEATPFAAPALAAQTINSWVADATKNRIRDLITPNSLDAQTSAILVNVIYFKAKWEKEFSTSDTQKHDFYTSAQRTLPVDMMFNDDTYLWGDFPSLQAKVLQMSYKNSELSMLVILPDDKNGLPAVEQRLRNIDLATIAANLKLETVTLRFPKFKIEFDIDMVEPLQRLGIRELFTNNAQLGGFFKGNQAVGISKIQHRAFIEVNEAGSEAAAASFAKFIPLSLPPRQIYFTADHPFIFAIRSPQAVYFVGHVVL